MRPLYYQTYDKGEYIGTYSAKELSTMIHCGSNVPSNYADFGMIYKGRYRFKRVDEPETSFEKEWDEVRLKILKSIKKARDGARLNENQGKEHGRLQYTG